MMSDEQDFFLFSDEISKIARAQWLQKGSLQIKLDEVALEAIDRTLRITEGDVLICESTLLEYAVHVLSSAEGIEELWVVPPHLPDFAGSVAELLDCFKSKLPANLQNQLNTLEEREATFKGLTADIPTGPFKLLITDTFDTFDPFALQNEWSVSSPLWDKMLETKGSTGAVIYPIVNDPSPLFAGYGSSVPTRDAEGVYYSGGVTSAVELPGGHVMLAVGKKEGRLHVEDLSNASDPWVDDVAPITVAVNNGNLLPSSLRSCVKVTRETTLGELSLRISRGTTLSEKSLDFNNSASSTNDHGQLINDEIYLTSYMNSDGKTLPYPGIRGVAPSYGGFYCYPGDFYYIDGSSLQDGAIRPKVLNDIPRGQERYVVDSRDKEVLLVSRSNKAIAAYKHIERPTLIGNGVFVIRLNENANLDYIACWMRGSFAGDWIRTDGKLLTKKLLASLPVPILDEKTMGQTVRYEQSIDESIYELHRQIKRLKGSSRFNPLAATGKEISAQESAAEEDQFDEDIPF